MLPPLKLLGGLAPGPPLPTLMLVEVYFAGSKLNYDTIGMDTPVPNMLTLQHPGDMLPTYV